MSVEIREFPEERYLEVLLSGTVSKADYAQFVPPVEAAITRYGKVSLLVIIHDFHGWTAGAFWEDIKFDWKHFRDLARLAIVGETKWEAGMATFCRPFTTATIKYFDVSKLDEARRWLVAPVGSPASAT